MNIQPLQNKYFKSFIDLDINNKFENFTFNQAVYFISYDKNITICEQLLKYLYEKTNIDIMISVREFLSLYMIYYFHNDVLSTQKNETETLLYESSKEIVLYNFDDLINNNTYDQNEINIHLYVKKLNTFGILFHIWKKKDKESQKEIYISLYIDYTEEIKKFIDKANDINRFKEYEQYINQLLHMKKVIKKCLISLLGKKEYKSIKETKFNPIGLFDNESKELVHNYLIEAYWNIFKDNIDSDNKIIDTTIIKKLGITIKEYFDCIYLHNKDKLDKIYNKIDFIIDKIIYTNNSSDYLIDLIYLMYNELIFLHPNHKLLSVIETNLENLENNNMIITTLKILMKEFSKYKQ